MIEAWSFGEPFRNDIEDNIDTLRLLDEAYRAAGTSIPTPVTQMSGKPSRQTCEELPRAHGTRRLQDLRRGIALGDDALASPPTRM